MDAWRTFDLVILAALGLVAMRLIPAAWRVTRIYLGIRTRRLADGSQIAPPAPSAVAALAQQLGTLGFRRIGERTVVLPGVGRRFEWNLVDESTTTYIALVPTPNRPPGVQMACYTAFTDGAFVATYYPDGTAIQREDLVTGPGGSSVEECVRTHRRRVAEFGARHGLPLLNRTMEDLLDRDATYRSRHGGATLRRRVWALDGLAAAVVVAAGLQLIRVVALG